MATSRALRATVVFASAALACAVHAGHTAQAGADVPLAPWQGHEPARSPNPCAGAPITPMQLTGGWRMGAGPQVTTLGADGTLRAERTDGGVTTGTWTYSEAEFSPAKDSVPPEAGKQCVIWFNTPKATLPVFAPWRLSGDTLELSLVGRGNTVVWHRP
ncbi:hypothetical protein [Mycolicibacterium fortuitum]